MTSTRILASIYPHEQDAMQQLVLTARAVASTLPPLDVHAVKLRVWAQMVEDIIERIEQEERVDG